ncbi:MAG: hypothetical protein J5449_10925 [Oscillospiraceae bacterium]|nr:hypothetical protein [Oscillospiraceae bacterium]
MKNTSLTTKLITAAVFVALTVYAIFLAWNYLTASETVSMVYSYRTERTLALDGVAVRDETVIECSDPLVELTMTEGERVAKGASLATVYSSSAALAEAKELDALREQLEQLYYARNASRDTEAALRLDREVESDIIALNAALANGNYTALESAASALKGTVLRREYAYRGGVDLGGRIEALEQQIESASGAGTGASRKITAPFSGTYSAAVDGWENVLDPELLRTLTPSEFERLSPDSEYSTVGKLIRGDKWYYAAVVSEEDARALDVSESYTLLIAGIDEPLPVSVYLLSKEENGRRLLVLTGDRYLSQVTTLRAQGAELVLENYSGLRVPKNALRIDENGQTGVYCRIGRFAYFKPVELIYQSEEYVLVEPGEIHAARDGDVVLYTIRAGDEAIITASELYNGKVIK